MRIYHVYILTNKARGTLYVGVTGNMARRILEHKLGILDGFTEQYNLKRLVYIEAYQYVNDALKREKNLKNWPRDWKINLIEAKNPEWLDLSKFFISPVNHEQKHSL